MRRLEVRLDMGSQVRRVGELAERDRRIYFEYDPDFVQAGFDLSPFHLPRKEGLIEGPREPYGGLAGLFNDSLPDGWGLLLMDRAFRARGLRPEMASPLERLSYIGARGMGALTYHPASGPAGPDQALIDLGELAAQSQRLLEGSTEDVLPVLLKAGGSPGGARPKVLVGVHEVDGTMISGSEVLPEGYRSFIVKFASRGDLSDAGPVELAYARMAEAAGITMPGTRLFETADSLRCFAAERFDRALDGRRHVHTLSGLLHADHRLPSLDYETFFRATWALTRDHGAVREAFRRMVFNVLSVNRDDHAKNFAYRMDLDGQWRLAPAYDLMYCEGPGGEHTMSIAGEGANPGMRQFEELAAKMSLSGSDLQEIVGSVAEAVGSWQRFARECGVSPASEGRIGERRREVRQRTLSRSPGRGHTPRGRLSR